MSLPSQEWLDSHYHWAANIVGAWIGDAMDIRSARIVDFGCGDGTISLGVADHFSPQALTGLDIRDSFKNIALTAEAMTQNRRLPANIAFRQIEPCQRLAGSIDANVVFSWSCFEHIERHHLATIFQDIHDLLPPGGLLFVQIEPLYFSPYGSHLRSFIEEPWQHLLVSDEELRQRVRDANPGEKDRARIRNSAVPLEQRKNYHLRQYGTLNRLTADELVRFGRNAGFSVKKEQRSTLDLEPPAALVAQYGRDALITNETRVLFQKKPLHSAATIGSRIKRLVAWPLKPFTA